MRRPRHTTRPVLPFFFYHLIYHLTTLSSGVILYTLLGSLSEFSDSMITHSHSYLGARI